MHQGVVIEGALLTAPLKRETMESNFGHSASVRSIPMHPSGERHVFEASSGVIWFLDLPEDSISHFHIPIWPADTPEAPQQAFTGEVVLNGSSLSSEIMERTLPRNGAVEIKYRHRRHFYETENHVVDFTFARRRNEVGKRSGVPRLAYISVSVSHSETASSEQGAADQLPARGELKSY